MRDPKRADRVASVAFRNVPSFVYEPSLPVTVHGRTVPVDVAFGGAFYAIVDAEAAGGLQEDVGGGFLVPDVLAGDDGGEEDARDDDHEVERLEQRHEMSTSRVHGVRGAPSGIRRGTQPMRRSSQRGE